LNLSNKTVKLLERDNQRHPVISEQSQRKVAPTGSDPIREYSQRKVSRFFPIEEGPSICVCSTRERLRIAHQNQIRIKNSHKEKKKI
jgi:hypothetical protein